MALKADAAAERPRYQLSRDFYGSSIFPLLQQYRPIPDEADARRIMQIALGDHSVEFETKHWNLDKVCWSCPIGFSQFLIRKGESPTRV